MVLGVVVMGCVLSGKGDVGGSDESNRCELSRLSQGSQSWFSMPALWEQEAVDALRNEPTLGNDDSDLRLNRLRGTAQNLRVAGTPERAQGSGQAGKGATVEDKVDGFLRPTGTERMEPTDESGNLWLISHYTAGVNFGGTSYPFGSATASGLPAQPGVVACGPSYRRDRDHLIHVVIGGWDMVCADTGNPSYVYDGVADIWCEGESWGPTDAQYAGEWWYGLPCPNPCEVEAQGRCWATVRVIQ